MPPAEYHGRMAHIVIGNSESERVTIELIGTGAGAWVVARIEIACGVWRGAFRCEFYGGELHQFGEDVEQLYRALNGTAKLTPMEPNLCLELTGDGLGHIAVSGKAEAEFYTGTHLVFNFSLDQTQLPLIAAALLRT
jgi:hypothetical protein